MFPYTTDCRVCNPFDYAQGMLVAHVDSRCVSPDKQSARDDAVRRIRTKSCKSGPEFLF